MLNTFTPTRRGPLAKVASVLLMLALCACTSQQWYGAGQGWQKNECHKIVDASERSRCLKNADTNYDAYQRQTEDAKSGAQK